MGEVFPVVLQLQTAVLQLETQVFIRDALDRIEFTAVGKRAAAHGLEFPQDVIRAAMHGIE